MGSESSASWCCTAVSSGVTVYPDDAQSVAWGVLSILRDPARAVARAKEAQQVARCEFNWDTIAARTIADYQRVLDERKRIDWDLTSLSISGKMRL